MRDWKLYALLVTLGPVLWVQGKYVRKVTPRLPDPPGDRDGIMGTGPRLRLLITGDSAAAGVGSSHQEEALSGQLVQQLAKHYTVEWQLIAISGLDSKTMLEMLAEVPESQFDVVVLSMGVNDVTALTTPSRWIALQEKLLIALRDKFQPQVTFHCAVPPMERFTALPQPLRWFMGTWAKTMNQQLVSTIDGHDKIYIHHPFKQRVPGGLAEDGFHPGPLAYKVWGESLGQEVLNSLSGQTPTA